MHTMVYHYHTANQYSQYSQYNNLNGGVSGGGGLYEKKQSSLLSPSWLVLESVLLCFTVRVHQQDNSRSQPDLKL